MDYTKSNLNILKNRYSHIYKLLQMQTDMIPECRVMMENGLGNIVFFHGTDNEYYLYDKENALQEFAIWIQSLAGEIEGQDHILLYGLGLGYHLKLLLEHYPNKWIYVYEPNINLFISALISEDLNTLLSHPNVKALAIGSSKEQKRQLIYPICTLAQGSCAFIEIPSYKDKDSIGIQRLLEEIPLIATEYKVQQNTLIHFKDIWMRNRLNHLATNLISTPLQVIKGAFSGYPAIIVGSGPSLQEDLENISRMKDYCLIIAAGSSLQALLHHGITPHLVVVVDGGPIVENIFRTPESLQIPMLYTPTTNFNITDRAQTLQLYAFDDTDLISPYYISPDGDIPVFRSLASVSGTAVQAAIYMGCEEIILVGQDFSFPEEKHYAKGIAHIKEQHVQAVVNGADVLVENVSGGMNRTNLPYKVLQNSMEEVISWYPDVKFMNASKIGAKITGTEWVPMEQLEQQIGLKKLPSIYFQKIVETNKSKSIPNHIQIEQVKERLKDVTDEMDVILQKLRDVRRQISKLAELSRKNPVKCSNIMVSIESTWSSITESGLFSILFEPLLPAELQFFDNHLSLIVEERNIIQKAKYFDNYLGKIVQELIDVYPKLNAIYKEAIERIEKVGNSLPSHK